MNRCLRKLILISFSIASLIVAFADSGVAQNVDSNTGIVGLVVTSSTELATANQMSTAAETATVAKTETAAATAINYAGFDPGEIAVAVTQLPNTGARDTETSTELGIALLAITGVILTGSAGTMTKQRS